MFTILNSMVTEIDEPITVGAVFARGAVKPVWFSRQGRQVRIQEIAFSWKTHRGSASVLHFSVTDGRGLYEILFDQQTMEWRAARAEPR